MNVLYGEKFRQHLKNFPKSDQLKIKAFVEYVEEFGFDGLQGRNKSSDDVPKAHPNWQKIVAYAQEHQLWHYHIGIPNHTLSDKGDMTSEYVPHYTKGDDFIKLVDLSAHPPLQLPTIDYLT